MFQAQIAFLYIGLAKQISLVEIIILERRKIQNEW